LILGNFKPNRTIDLDARISSIENYLAALAGQLAALLKTSTKQIAIETLSAVESGAESSSGGDGGSFSGDATSIQGEPIDDDLAAVDGDILTYDTATEEWTIRQWIDGRLGIGTGAAATARLQLPAGTVTAGTAPFKMTAGTRLTAVEAGAWNYDGTRVEVVPNSHWRSASLSSDHVIASTSVANTITRTTVAQGVTGANSLDGQQTIVLHLYGRYSTANAVDTFTLTCSIAGVDVISVVSTGATVTDQPVYARFIATVRGAGGGGTVWGWLDANINNLSKMVANTTTTAVNFGATNTPKIDVTWSAALPGNTFSADVAFFQILN
jgi:hypothetical protein